MEMLESLIAGSTSPGSMVYNVSQALLIISMSMRNVTWLRVIALTSGVLGLTYHLYIEPSDVSVFWSALFVSINVIQLMVLWSERLRPRLSDEEEYFISLVVPTVHRMLARRLVQSADFRRVEPGFVITRKDEVVQELAFLLEGSAEVRAEDRVLGHCHRGDFVGEMSFVTGKPATANVVADTQVRYFAFDRERLGKVLATSDELRHAVEASFNRNLVDKLGKTNGGTSTREQIGEPG